MFQFRRFPSYTYLIQCRMTGYCPAGLPHSEIHGSRDICSSPWLIAACHVLRRLLMPRHSPCALISLTNRKLAIPRSFSLWIMQAISKIGNCNCYPHLSRCCSTIKITFVSVPFQTQTSLLPYFTLCYIVQFSRCIAFQPLLKPDWNTQFHWMLQSNFNSWWRLAGSNRWPPACKDRKSVV